MPISRKSFEEGSFKKKYSDRNKHPVTLFLQRNKYVGFTVKEIVKSTKVKAPTVRGCLKALKKERKILHKAPYFIWKIVKKVRKTKKRK